MRESAERSSKRRWEFLHRIEISVTRVKIFVASCTQTCWLGTRNTSRSSHAQAQSKPTYGPFPRDYNSLYNPTRLWYETELSPRAGKVALRGNLCSQMMDRYQESALNPGLLWEIDIVTRVIPATTNLRNARNIRKPVGFLVGVKRANGLTKPSNGLASRYAGLGLGATPKSKPKPEKARLRGHKPVLQAENVTLKTRGWSARLRLGVLMARTRGEYRKG
ncbi:hypothetical protein B0H13DRAFT_1911014 [Mycena leptocephala]|nr:hypothetical protein B0H13DRAFT_1911014 [Mycena leptocephala]